jgi:hypothetical protein
MGGVQASSLIVDEPAGVELPQPVVDEPPEEPADSIERLRADVEQYGDRAPNSIVRARALGWKHRRGMGGYHRQIRRWLGLSDES